VRGVSDCCRGGGNGDKPMPCRRQRARRGPGRHHLQRLDAASIPFHWNSWISNWR